MNVKEHIKEHENKHQITTILKEGCDEGFPPSEHNIFHKSLIVSPNLVETRGD